MSARATDDNGVMGSAPVRRIVVPKSPAVRVTRLVWRAGVLELRLVAPRGVTVTAVVGGRHSSRQEAAASTSASRARST